MKVIHGDFSAVRQRSTDKTLDTDLKEVTVSPLTSAL